MFACVCTNRGCVVGEEQEERRWGGGGGGETKGTLVRTWRAFHRHSLNFCLSSDSLAVSKELSLFFQSSETYTQPDHRSGRVRYISVRETKLICCRRQMWDCSMQRATVKSQSGVYFSTVILTGFRAKGAAANIKEQITEKWIVNLEVHSSSDWGWSRWRAWTGSSRFAPGHKYIASTTYNYNSDMYTISNYNEIW